MKDANETDRAATHRRDGAGDRSNKQAEIAVAVDWLSFTVSGIAVDAVLPIIERVVPTTWVPSRGRSGYRNSLKGEKGSRVLWSPDRSDTHIDLPGQWWASAGQKDMQALLVAFAALGGRWSRCDLAGTDSQRIVEPEDVADAIRRGQYVSRARQLKGMENFVGGKETTVYIGSNTSRQQLLVYDKEAQSGGTIPGVRWELRSRAAAAVSLVASLMESMDWGTVWARRVVGFVDFRERKPGSDPSRCGRTAWFAQLVGSARRASASAPVPDSRDGVNRDWLQHQVAPSPVRLVELREGALEPVHELGTHGLTTRNAAAPRTEWNK